MEVISIGKILSISEEIKISETLTKKTFIILDNKTSRTPYMYEFALFNANCKLINEFAIGTEIKVTGLLRSRENNDENAESKITLWLSASKIEEVPNSLLDFKL